MSFTRVVEDFVCTQCHHEVKGSGYTNHCPECLWSMHVDNEPGDRAAVCGGMMEPVRIEGTATQYRIVHLCQRCSIDRTVKVATNDNWEAVIAIVQKSIA